VVDGSGLEIRIQDFGLNWTACATIVLAFHLSIFLTLVNWTRLDTIGLNIFVRVTIVGYLFKLAQTPAPLWERTCGLESCW